MTTRTKRCRACGKTKPITEFRANTHQCTTCVDARVTGVDVRGARRRAPDRSAPAYQLYRPEKHDRPSPRPGAWTF